ncbi:MAG: HD domain-containing protein, partial [Candidatus Thorarchaeota archaeon]
MDIKKDVSEHVDCMLENWSRSKISEKKVITDAVLGAMTFEPYEMHVIDCPIVQRIRRIHQLGPAFLLYPAANHTRFDHSLGVCTLADRIWRSLNDKHGDSIIPTTALMELRMAAILHDVGHGPFSHVSEEVMKSRFPEIRDLIQKEDGKFWGCKPHEVMSHFIVTSKPFTDFMSDIRTLCGGLELNLNRVADIIIGRVDEQEQHQWKADIINGRFDADKLDYMLRDAYFTGIKIQVDIERVLLTLDQDTRSIKKIVGQLKGVHTLEQILFNKMFLFSALYHHHKLRSAECLVKLLYEHAFDSGEGIAGYKLKTPIDFLRLTDYDVLAGAHNSNDVNEIANRIKNRNLFYRALTISNHSVIDE